MEEEVGKSRDRDRDRKRNTVAAFYTSAIHHDRIALYHILHHSILSHLCSGRESECLSLQQPSPQFAFRSSLKSMESEKVLGEAKYGTRSENFSK